MYFLAWESQKLWKNQRNSQTKNKPLFPYRFALELLEDFEEMFYL